MWLLLVAAGSGYLARCWQNALKTRPALTDCAQISSRPGSPTNSAATSGFGSPPSTWEKGSGTSKEDPQTGRKAHELRRQLSSGAKPFHVKGLGRKLLYDSCGQGSSRFSRSDDGLDGTDERKRLIDNAGSFSDDDDTGKRKSGACCGLGGSKRSDVSESSVAGLTTVGGRSCHELTLHNPDVDENEKGPSFSSTQCPDAPRGQEENTFEISLLKDEISSVPSMACVNGPSLSVSNDDLRKGFSVSEKAIHRRSTTTDSLFGFAPPPNGAPSSYADATGTEHCWELEELESPSAASGRSDVCINSKWTPVHRESGKLAEVEPGGELQVLDTHSKVLSHAAGSGVGRPSSPGPGGMNASCFDQAISYENVQYAQSELDVCYQYQEQGCRTTTTEFVDCLTTPETACLRPHDTDSGPNFEPPGKVLLSFFSGKRVNDFASGAFKDGNEDPGLSSGKRKKDSFSGRQEDGAAHEPLANNLSSGLLDPSLGCLGFDATWFEMQPDGDEKSRNGWMPRKIKTPSRCSRGKACIRKARWLKGSPKVVSSLESCLRAQLVHDISKDNDRHASRALYFQATSEGGTLPEMRNNSSDRVQVPEQAQEEPTGPRKMYGGSHNSGANVAVGLPSLENHVQMGTGKRSTPRECKSSSSQVARTMLDVSSRRYPLSVIMKKRKTSEKSQTLSTSLQFEREGSHSTKDMVLQPIDGLLFSFGVGVGVMSMVNTSKEEIETISALLRQSQEHVELLKQELSKVPCMQTGLSAKALSGGNLSPEVKSDLIQLRRAEHGETNKLLATSDGLALEEANRAGGMVEVQQNGDHMAELEAELEAELQLMELNLTGDSSSCHRRQFSGLSDLDVDGIADVVEGELKVKGLPRPADPDDDQIASTHDEEVHPNNWAVSPRDLDRRLRKLLITRQEENIAELEAELEVAESKLSSKEKELQWWKDRFQKVTQLTGLSSKPGEGSRSAIPYGDDTGEEKAGEQFTPVGNRDLKVVGKTTGGSPEGMPGQHRLTDPKRKSSVACRAVEKVTFNEHAGFDAVLFSEALASETANDDVCDEFLKAVIERETGAATGDDKYQLANILSPIPNRSQEESPFGKAKRGQAGMDTGRGTFSSGNSNPLARIQYPQEHSVSENVPSMQAGSSPTLTSSPASKKLWTTRVDEVWGPMKLYATRFGSNQDELQATVPSQDNEWEAARPRPFIVNTDMYGGAMRHVHADLSSPSLEPVGNTAIFGPTSVIVDVDHVESVTACIAEASERSRHWNSGAVSRAGANTPVDNLILQQVASTSKEALSVLTDGQESHGASSSVLDKVKHWEGMVRRDSPVALGRLSDWDAQSWTSESEQVHPLVGEDLFLGAEATLGEILIKRIVEKTRRGSHIVKVAETALTSTGDDNGEILPSQNALTSQAAQVLVHDHYPPGISSTAYHAPPGAKVGEDPNIDISSSDDFARFLNASPQRRVRKVLERNGHEDRDESCTVSEEPAERGDRHHQGKLVP